MTFLEKVSRHINRIFLWAAGIFLVAMILLTCANIFSRWIWAPIRGTFELMGFFSALVTAFVLGYTQMKKAHISVDILVNRFSPAVRRILNAANSLICTIFFAVAGWQIAKWGATLRRTGEVTETLRIIYYPFTYGVGLGCFLLALVLLVDFCKAFRAQNGDN